LNFKISSNTEYSDQVFVNLRLSAVKVASSQFFDCGFSDCTFTESVFQKCRLANCVFQACDLSLLQVPESVFSTTRFEDSKIIGVNWAQADWPSTGLWKPPEFVNSIISHSTFIGLSLEGMLIKDCVALDVDFREADLSHADFTGTDLSRSLFKDTNLTEADMSQARNYEIDPGQNILKGAKFSLPEAMSLLYSMDINLSDET
jgi:fluoroquinolone resistance protein